MRINRDLRLPPAQQNIRVVPLRLRNLPHAIHKIQRLPKIRKPETPVQMMVLRHLPLRQLRLERIQRLAFQRGNAALARHARLVG